MNEHDVVAERFARRQFLALQQAGLKSWTFAEFCAFCAPELRRLTAAPAIEMPASIAARTLADAVRELLQTRYGEPLGPRSRDRIIRTAHRSLVAGNRRRLRLATRS